MLVGNSNRRFPVLSFDSIDTDFNKTVMIYWNVRQCSGDTRRHVQSDDIGRSVFGSPQNTRRYQLQRSQRPPMSLAPQRCLQ